MINAMWRFWMALAGLSVLFGVMYYNRAISLDRLDKQNQERRQQAELESERRLRQQAEDQRRAAQEEVERQRRLQEEAQEQQRQQQATLEHERELQQQELDRLKKLEAEHRRQESENLHFVNQQSAASPTPGISASAVAPYQGPSYGSLIWSGEVNGERLVTIKENQPSSGNLT